MTFAVELNATHDPARRSWVDSANRPGTDFPLQNLPLGMASLAAGEPARPAMAIGDDWLDLTAAAARGLLDGQAAQAVQLLHTGRLNELMGADPALPRALRHAVFALLAADSPAQAALADGLHPQAGTRLQLPVQVGDFSDFSVSRAHNATLGKVAQREVALHPNFNHLPIAYHGRCSSLVASGQGCRRPLGQRGARTDAQPSHGPSQKLDYELELGLLIGQGSALGEPVALADAEQHLFGLCLLNDWSARDIQSWEITPLGPFQGKSFMTTLSPWVVGLEALAPFRCATAARPAELPPLFAHYLDARVQALGGLQVRLQAAVQSQRMREAGQPPQVLGVGQLAEHPWSVFQLIAHQTHNGCNLRPGDLIGTGTVSGAGPGEQGCLQELSLGGSRPFSLGRDEQRSFLLDGDEVLFSARCERDGFVGLGFGECRGQVLPAHSPH